MSHGAKKQTLQVGGGGSGNDKGYFTDITALNTAYPSGSDGWYAVLGSTDTIWIWDSGTSAWVDSGGGGSGTPGGSDTQIQVNNAGAFAGYPELKYDNTTKELIIGAEDDYGGIKGPDATTLDAFGGGISLNGGAGDGYGDGGSFSMFGGFSQSGSGGVVSIEGGEGYTYQGGYLEMLGGPSYSGDGGYLDMRGGDSNYGEGGLLYMQGGESAYGNAGNLEMQGGGGQFAVGGSFFMQGGSGIVGGNFTLQPGYGTGVTDGIYTFSVVDQGLGYVIGDTVEVNGTAGTKSVFIINNVGPLGEAYTVNRITLEGGYTTGIQTTTTLTGIGTGLTINIEGLVTGDIGKIFLQQALNTGGFKTELDISALTANQVHTFPDQSGTIALTSDIPTGLIKLPTYTVGASGADYTTIQGAIDAATTGGTIYVTDGTYAEFVYKYNNTRVIGNGYKSIIQADCASVPTLVKANASGITGCSLENFYLANTNVTAQGVGLDFSNMPRNLYKNLYFYNLGYAIKGDDTANQTFYNTFQEIAIYECNNGIYCASANPINNNRWYNVRTALKAGGAGKGLYMNNSQGNTFYDLNVEPGTAVGITGIHLDTVNCVNTVFHNAYIENNALGISITGAQRATFIGGMCVANSVDISDNGLDTTYIGFNKNYVLYQQLVNMELVDKSNASKYAVYGHNNTSYAHTGGYLALLELLNGSDTSEVLRLKNAGSGKLVSALAGTTEVFSVDNSGSSSTMLSQVQNIINKNTTLNAGYSSYIPGFLEIADTYTLTVSDTSYLQVG